MALLRALVAILLTGLFTAHTSPERLWLDSPAARCILFHESTNGKLSPNLWQFQDGTFKTVTGLDGPPGSYPRAVQDAAAYTLYLERGWQPWTTRFVCGLGHE